MTALRGEPETGEGRRTAENHSGEGMLMNQRIKSTPSVSSVLLMRESECGEVLQALGTRCLRSLRLKGTWEHQETKGCCSISSARMHKSNVNMVKKATNILTLFLIVLIMWVP